jgi:hypothetical protein
MTMDPTAPLMDPDYMRRGMVNQEQQRPDEHDAEWGQRGTKDGSPEGSLDDVMRQRQRERNQSQPKDPGDQERQSQR